MIDTYALLSAQLSSMRSQLAVYAGSTASRELQQHLHEASKALEQAEQQVTILKVNGNKL